ncbi:MAG: SDR family oxidoreductase [Planctomycetota bacterium]
MSERARHAGSRLTGKTVLVTGAGRGIGAACACACADQGAWVLATDLDAGAAAGTARSIGPMALSRPLDVRVEDDWESVIAFLDESRGGPDVLVNNAGITGFDQGVAVQDPEHATLDGWRAVHDTNLDGVFLGCRAAIRSMRAHGRGGSIINMASRSGVVGIPRASAYASSKAAVRHHTKSVALYCAEEGLGIRCNAVQPAAIMTPMWDAMLGDGPDRAERERAIAKDTPLNRFGTTDEVAALVVYLASDESRYVTGAEFDIDGGMRAGSASPPGAAGD